MIPRPLPTEETYFDRQKLREYLLDHYPTITDASLHALISYKTLYSWIRGDSTPTFEHICRVAAAWQVSILEFAKTGAFDSEKG